MKQVITAVALALATSLAMAQVPAKPTTDATKSVAGKPAPAPKKPALFVAPKEHKPVVSNKAPAKKQAPAAKKPATKPTK